MHSQKLTSIGGVNLSPNKYNNPRGDFVTTKKYESGELRELLKDRLSQKITKSRGYQL